MKYEILLGRIQILYHPLRGGPDFPRGVLLNRLVFCSNYLIKTMKTKIENREQWLMSAVELTKPLFESHGYKVPQIRVACGWPSKGGLAAKKRTIGQCWPTTAASDAIGQIFISPFLGEPTDSEQGVLATLVHEVCHAVVGCKEKHNKVFGKCARCVGLEGKLTATVAGDPLLEQMTKWAKILGPYPHGTLDRAQSPDKKQSTRLIKCECPECGYVCRTTRKWLEEVGAPWCPAHNRGMDYELP